MCSNTTPRNHAEPISAEAAFYQLMFDVQDTYIDPMFKRVANFHLGYGFKRQHQVYTNHGTEIVSLKGK